MNFVKSILLAAALATLALAGNAATVVNTGTSASGSGFTSSGTGTTGTLVSISHPSYLPDDAASGWVWDAALAVSPVTFTLAFDLTNLTPRPQRSAACGVSTTSQPLI